MARVMAVLAVLLTAGFAIYGLLSNGLSWETQHRLWSDVIDRSHGPMTFRFFLQPAMAGIAALHDGIADARIGRAPFLHALLYGEEDRGTLVWQQLYSTSRIILLGFAMDAIYQWQVLKTFYPGEALVITLILAVIPYLILRGPFCRIARWWMARKAHAPSHE